MNLYLETSAVLRDVLEGEQAAEIRAILRGAEIVATSPRLKSSRADWRRWSWFPPTIGFGATSLPWGSAHYLER